MKPFLDAFDVSSRRNVSVDPNRVKINDAGTNMMVATYCERDLDRGDKRPKFVNFSLLHLKDEERQILENIFKNERKKIAKKRKDEKNCSRKRRKEKKSFNELTLN